MKRIGLVLILSLFTYHLCSCQSLPTKKQQYDFLKWYVKTKEPKSLSRILIPFDENMIALSSINLNDSNIKYLKKQLAGYTKDTLLDTTVLKGNYWSVKPDTNRSTISLSLPIFSINKKIAAIHWETGCGWECGGDHIEVYEKNRAGRWVVSKRHIKSIYL